MTSHGRDVEAFDAHQQYHDEDEKIEKVAPNESPPADDPFGNEEMAEVKFRTMKWWNCGMREFSCLLGHRARPPAFAI